MRSVRADPPAETGELDGLAWARFAPEGGQATCGVVLLHGADSRKESHFDFARACASGGLAALAFDARGHGASPGPLDGRGAGRGAAGGPGPSGGRAGAPRTGAD